MGDGLKRVGQVAIFAVAFFGVRYGIQTYQQHSVNAELAEAAANLKAKALQHHPDLSPAAAIQQEAVTKTDELIKSAPDGQKRQQTAAATFLGVYFVNTRTRTEYCDEQGTSIQPFVEAFQRNHIKELAAARSILANAHTDEEKIYTLVKTQMRSTLENDMNDIARANQTNAKGACELIAAKADILADKLRLSQVQPAVYQALMQSQ